ncbi:hypothetical protein NKJ16_15610 [Mesorhizobium sp. M0179]|uniref:hypothetical protein n=1 Tax=Mesorhizobium sp. M0179 TaxID=2956905 RepID=UPI0033366E96
MDAIEERGSKSEVYLWSDDNLSTDLLLRKDSRTLLERIQAYGRGYGKACCVKGFDAESFAFNTAAEGSGFEEQLLILRGYSESGLDLHIYVTLTAPPRAGDREAMKRFIDRLVNIRDDLPGRAVPLLVSEFATMTARMNPMRAEALGHQWRLLDMWCESLHALGLAERG